MGVRMCGRATSAGPAGVAAASTAGRGREVDPPVGRAVAQLVERRFRVAGAGHGQPLAVVVARLDREGPPEHPLVADDRRPVPTGAAIHLCGSTANEPYVATSP